MSPKRHVTALLAANLCACLVVAQQRDAVFLTRLYTGSDGQTHADRKEVSFVPRADGVGLSPVVKATGFFYLRLQAGQVQDWHTAPRRQYVVALSGRNEIELGDGQKISLEPGTVVLAEDLTGKGHISRCLGPQNCIVVEIPLAEQQ